MEFDNDKSLSAAAVLRRLAEEQLKAKVSEAYFPRTDDETQRLLHELQVHQIEMEMQNAELRQTRNELESLLAKYTDLFDFAPVGYFTIDLTGDIRAVNLSGASLLGVERARLIGRRFDLFVADKDRPAFAAFLGKVFTSTSKKECAVALLTEGHSPLLAQIEAVPAISGQECRITVIDIHERKKIEANLIKEKNLESLGTLAGGLAHDFNNLLHGLLGYISLAKMYLSTDSEPYLFLKQAEEMHSMGRGLTNQLLVFAPGGISIRKTIKPEALIRDAVSFSLRGSNIQARFDLALNLWDVHVDSDQLRQVINNMVLNAREAMPTGGSIKVKAVNVTIDLDSKILLAPGRYICISIGDHGDGITADNLSRIFDPYFSTKERGPQKGMGLGLTICDAIIRKHGGGITVDSKVGKGSTFNFYLPATDADDILPVKRAGVVAAPGGFRVLVMDDDPGVFLVVKEFMKLNGYFADSVTSGDEAVRAYKMAQETCDPYVTVILNLSMPGGKGGIETLAMLREIDPNVKAVVSSGYADDPVITNFNAFGFVASIVKPYRLETLKQTLKAIIG